MEKIKKGFVRDDGMVFVRYQKRKKVVSEYWLTPEKYLDYLKAAALRARKSKSRSIAKIGLADFRLKRKQQQQTRREIIKSDPLTRSAYLQKTNAVNLKRINKCPLNRLSRSTRCSVHRCLKLGTFSKVFEHVGCSVDFLKSHLESHFQAGMTWDNWSRNGWHIDHVVPLSSAKSIDELKSLFHYTNLRPLWAFDNLSKGPRYQP